MLIINESGMYQAIFRSNSEKAQDFRYWVTNDILPSLRLTGKVKLNKKERERLAIRKAGIETRKSLTDAIKESQILEQELGSYKYASVTNLAYKLVFGKTYAELKKERLIPKGTNLRDNMNEIELKEVERAEDVIRSLIDNDYGSLDEIEEMARIIYRPKELKLTQ